MKIIRFFWGLLRSALRWLWQDWFLKTYYRRYWYRNVYLRSEHWQKFRKRALGHYNWICQIDRCKIQGPHLELHHLTYENIGHEKLKDVRPLCWKHHDLIESGVSLMLKNGDILSGYKKYSRKG